MDTKKQNLKRFMIYIDSDLLEKMRKVAIKYNRSVNGQVIWVLKQLVEKEGKLFKKTNRHWYPYKDMGAYYKLENGALFSANMEKDGNIAMVDRQVNGGEVDRELLEGEYLDEKKKILLIDRLNEISNELQYKE